MPFPADGCRRSHLSVALLGVISKIAVRVINFFTPSGISKVFTSYSHPMIFSPGQRLQIRNRFRIRQEKMRILFLSARKKILTEKPL
jgi:hypothetical protein